MKTIRATAKNHMKGLCRVYPICDGVACAGEMPGMGGGRQGVITYIDQIKNELISTMVLTGCPDIASVNQDILRPAKG